MKVYRRRSWLAQEVIFDAIRAYIGGTRSICICCILETLDNKDERTVIMTDVIVVLW